MNKPKRTPIRTAPFWYPGLRRLKVGEIMRKGDVMPDIAGTTQPIRESMIDWPVLGRRSSTEVDFVFRPRKRKEQMKVTPEWNQTIAKTVNKIAKAEGRKPVDIVKRALSDPKQPDEHDQKILDKIHWV